MLILSRLPGEFGKSQLVLTGVRTISKGEKSVFGWMAGPGLFFGDVEIPASTSTYEAGFADVFLYELKKPTENVVQPSKVLAT